MSEQKELSSHAVTSLTLGIISIFIPIFGLLLGILAIFFYRQSMQAQEKGKGLAVAGLVCGIIGVAFQLLILIGYFAFTVSSNETMIASLGMLK